MATLVLMLLHIIVWFCFSFPALFDAVSLPHRVFDGSTAVHCLSLAFFVPLVPPAQILFCESLTLNLCFVLMQFQGLDLVTCFVVLTALAVPCS